MENLDVRFHGICTHLDELNEPGARHRVVLLRCDDRHRPLLSMGPGAKVTKSGECECFSNVLIDDGDLHIQLDGVRVTMPGAAGGVHWESKWSCGMPKLTRLFPDLGPASDAKVRQEPPVGVAVWVDVNAGFLAPYVSCKKAVAVRLRTEYEEGRPARIEGRCWSHGVTWTFDFESGSRVQISNDCGHAGDDRDFIAHYQIVDEPPMDPPKLERLPECLPEPPEWADWPPGAHNASLGCSNSDYP